MMNRHPVLLEKSAVPLTVAETDDLMLHARAVTRGETVEERLGATQMQSADDVQHAQRLT